MKRCSPPVPYYERELPASERTTFSLFLYKKTGQETVSMFVDLSHTLLLAGFRPIFQLLTYTLKLSSITRSKYLTEFMSKLRKINNLKNPESFLQINTVKGFKYVDKAGEIVNAFHKGEAPPQFTMGLDGLIIEQPIDKIDTLRISSQIIWAKTTQIDSLDMVSRLFSTESKKILGILEIDKISRIGWRNYFIYEFQNKEEQESFFKKIVAIDGLQPVSISFKIDTAVLFQANLTIQPVIKENEVGATGVLFDVDIFQNKEIDTEHIQSTLDSFRVYIQDNENGLVKVLKTTFK